MTSMNMKRTVTVVAALAAAVVIPVAQAADKVDEKPKLAGYVQADYRLGEGNGETAQGYGEQEVNLRRARLVVSGKVNDLVGYGVTVQGDNTGGTLFRDMFATLNFDPKAKLTVGQFKYEFDIEGRESSTDRPFMDRATIVNLGGGGASGDFRDKGAQLSGMLGLGDMKSGYAVGVWQGNGGTNGISDANGGTTTGSPPAAVPSSGGNNSFMYTANLFLVPLKDTKINAGYMNNDSTADNTVAPALENEFSAWTVGGAYDVGPLLVRAEYYSRENTGAGVSTTAQGWYLLGNYSVLSNVDLLARYQTNDTEEVDNSTLTSIDLGAKYYFARKGKHGGSYVTANYMIRDADSAATTTLLSDGRGIKVSGDNVENVLAARVQVVF